MDCCDDGVVLHRHDGLSLHFAQVACDPLQPWIITAENLEKTVTWARVWQPEPAPHLFRLNSTARADTLSARLGLVHVV